MSVELELELVTGKVGSNLFVISCATLESHFSFKGPQFSHL